MEMGNEKYMVSEILNRLGVHYKRAGNKTENYFEYVMPFFEADERCLVFFNEPGVNTFADLTRGSFAAILLEHNWAIEHFHEIKNIDASIFIVKNPRLVISRILSVMYPNEDDCFNGIHSSAYVHPKAKIHKSVSIGPYCIIGNCEIGEQSKIYSSTVIKDNTIIGKNVTIREFCLIGGAGFGFTETGSGIDMNIQRIPHVGRVIIEDDVDIFPFVNVDRATLNETRIKRGTKIDHYSHISHNCVIGKHCIITAGTVFCGGSSIGDCSYVGIGSIIKGGLVVGSKCFLGMGSVVTKSIEDGWLAYGVPAKKIKRR